MADEFNYSAGLSSAGTILSTGANIYLSIQRGEIKAIENEMKANERKHQSSMADYDRLNKLAELDVQYAEQAEAMAKDFAGAGESQMMSAMMQGRSMDSLASTQSGDEQQYLMDKQKSLLNKTQQEDMIGSEYSQKAAMAQMDVNALKSASKMARTEGNINAVQAGLQGLTTLAKNNAFDPDYYAKKAGTKDEIGAEGDTKQVLKSYGQKKKDEFIEQGGYSDPFKNTGRY